MPITDLAPRARELGRIRAGEQLVNDKGKKYPSKLDTWRLTSPQREYLEAAAEVYGGTVTEWKDAPADGDHWQLVIEAHHLDVLVPPIEVVDAITQWWELWSGGGCLRRCTGEFGGPGGSDLTQGERCMCPADIAERLDLARQVKPQACKPTTRVTLILPRLPDLGVWVLVSHGTNAAVELPGSVSLLQRFAGQGVWVPGRLRLDARTSKKDGKTTKFGVPVLEIPQVTFGELIAGSGQRVLGGEQAAVEAGLRALPSGEAITGEGTSEPRAADAGAAPTTRGQAAAPARTRPNPSNPQGGGAFARNIRSKARRLHIDDDLLAGVVEEISGQRDVDAIHDPLHANKILDELDRVAEQKAATG